MCIHTLLTVSILLKKKGVLCLFLMTKLQRDYNRGMLIFKGGRYKEAPKHKHNVEDN